MKRCSVIFTLLLLVTAACVTDKKTDQADVQANVAHVDTFMSADRAFADLRGDVIRCVVTSVGLEQSGDSLVAPQDAIMTTLAQEFDSIGNIARVVVQDLFMGEPVSSSTFTFDFDANGALLASSNDLGGRFTVTRNSDGYVNTFTCINSGGDNDYTKKYAWSDGYLTSVQIVNDPSLAQVVDVIKYSYDDQGRCIREVEETGDRSLQLTVTETDYYYNDTDQHGNWISRDIRRMARIYDMTSGRRVLSDSVSTYQADTRTIDYALKHSAYFICYKDWLT